MENVITVGLYPQTHLAAKIEQHNYLHYITNIFRTTIIITNSMPSIAFFELQVNHNVKID